MSSRKKVIPTLAELRADLKEMTFREKVDHLWTYYKEWLVVVVLVVVAVCVTVTGIVNKGKEPLLRSMMANVSMSQRGYDYLTTDYFEKIGGKKGQEVKMTYTYFENLFDPTSTQDNYNASMRLVTQVSAEMLDYAIIDKNALEFYVTQAVFLDLRDVFTEEEMEALAQKDMLVYSMETPDGEDLAEGEIDLSKRIPIAVKMQSLPFAQDTMQGEEAFFIVAGRGANLEAVRGIWQHILDWKK